MNFCPPAVPRSGTDGGKRFRNSALAEYQNRKIFVSLIEKIFGARDLKMLRKFFCFARRQVSGNAGRDFCPSGQKLLLKKGSHFVQ